MMKPTSSSLDNSPTPDSGVTDSLWQPSWWQWLISALSGTVEIEKQIAWLKMREQEQKMREQERQKEQKMRDEEDKIEHERQLAELRRQTVELKRQTAELRQKNERLAELESKLNAILHS